MNNTAKTVNIQRLIDIGKDKGYLTYDELKNNLSKEFISSQDNASDFMIMLQELDIVIVDEESRKEVDKTSRIKKKPGKDGNSENARLEIPDSPSRVSDPVKMYLREMGSISLLTREGEVEIAKRIESGERRFCRGFWNALWELKISSIWANN